jgi:hypothetical protein
MQHRLAAILALLYTLGAVGASYLWATFPGLGASPPGLGVPVDFLLVLAFPLALLAAIVYAVAARTTPWRQRALPLVLLLAAVLLWTPAIRLGHWTRETLFRSNLPIYEAAVAPIVGGPAPRSVILPLDSLPLHAALCCGQASARIEADGSFRASFAVHRNLRMVYSPSALDTVALRPPLHGRLVQFAPNWYEEWH